MYCSHKFLVSPDRSYNFTCVSSFIRSSIRSFFLKTMQNIFFSFHGKPYAQKSSCSRVITQNVLDQPDCRIL